MSQNIVLEFRAIKNDPDKVTIYTESDLLEYITAHIDDTVLLVLDNVDKSVKRLHVCGYRDDPDRENCVKVIDIASGDELDCYDFSVDVDAFNSRYSLIRVHTSELYEMLTNKK